MFFLRNVFDVRGKFIKGEGWEDPGAEPMECGRCEKEHYRVFEVEEDGSVFTVGSGCVLKVLAGSPDLQKRAAELLKKFVNMSKRQAIAKVLCDWRKAYRKVEAFCAPYCDSKGRRERFMPPDVYSAFMNTPKPARPEKFRKSLSGQLTWAKFMGDRAAYWAGERN